MKYLRQQTITTTKQFHIHVQTVISAKDLLCEVDIELDYSKQEIPCQFYVTYRQENGSQDPKGSLSLHLHVHVPPQVIPLANSEVERATSDSSKKQSQYKKY